MSVQRCRHETAPHEFWDWLAHREIREERKLTAFDPTHYYLAQIVQYFVKVNVKPEDAKNIDLNTFLLKFRVKDDKKRLENMTPEQRMNNSKMSWGMFVGVNTLGKKNDK